VKRSAIRRKPRTADDRVTPALWAYVVRRDGGCMAPLLDREAGPCRNKWGMVVGRTHENALTVQHLWLDYSVKGDRAPSNKEHLLALCYGHHLGGWATRKASLDLQRAYLIRLAAEDRA
jgi:hypothetical protein